MADTLPDTKWFDGTSVHLLSAADFSDSEPWRLKKDHCCFILFYANWCGHCMHFKPEYIKFAGTAQFIRCYALDAVENEGLIDKVNSTKGSPIQIKGYPMLFVYKNGVPLEEYKGERDSKSLLKKAGAICQSVCKCGN